MMNSYDEIKALVAQKKLILFVGAGVSMPLGLPSWSQLVGKMANDLGFEPSIFETYGTALALAEYYKLEKGGLGALRSWMDQQCHQPLRIKNSKVHELIVELGFPIIYTTNYDHWLERAHEHHQVAYSKISSVTDFPKIGSGVQIIKFHGDVTDDSSIVLDETSYFERMDFNSPLDIKLRADAIGRGILFIGYSLSDVNMRLLLYKISRLWKGTPNEAIRPTSYLFSAKPNPVNEVVLKSWGIRMTSSDEDDPSQALLNFLSALRS